MKKTIITILSLFAFSVTTAQADISGWGLGVTMTSNDINQTYKEDTDTNGTINTTKNVADTADSAAIFVEKTIAADRVGVTFGIELIPFSADISKRTQSQSSLGNASDGTATSGDNTAEGSIDLHTTFYMQPGLVIGENTMLYGTLGIVMANLEAKVDTVSNSDFTETKTLDGSKVGVGIKHVADNGFFWKIDYSETDYDKLTWKTNNSTTVTGDLDNDALGFSIGKSF